METHTKVESFEIDYRCDECGEGMMRPTGRCMESYPPQYPHSCTVCKATKTFTNKRYPHIVHEPRRF
jgi:hypothetical protein